MADVYDLRLFSIFVSRAVCITCELTLFMQPPVDGRMNFTGARKDRILSLSAGRSRRTCLVCT